MDNNDYKENFDYLFEDIYKKILDNPNCFFELSSKMQRNEHILSFFLDNAYVKKCNNFSNNTYYPYYKVFNFSLNDELLDKAKKICITNGFCRLLDEIDNFNKYTCNTVDDLPRIYFLKDFQNDKNFLLINNLIDCLSSLESFIVRERFGLIDGKPKSLNDLSLIFNFSTERIRQIEKNALIRLSHLYIYSKVYLLDKMDLFNEENSLIFKLGLSDKTTFYLCNFLKIFTLDELLNLDDDAFKNISKFSKTSYEEIISKLDSLGIKRKSDFDRLCSLYMEDKISKDDILNLPIGYFSLSIRTNNYLRKKGFFYIKDLINLKDNDACNSNFGIISYNEVKDKFRILKECKNEEFIYDKNFKFENVLQMPIEALNLSVRTYNVCKRNNLNILFDFVVYDKKTFSKLPNIGKSICLEIEEKLLSYNLNFGMSKDSIISSLNFFDNSISFFNFSVRTYNYLSNSGIKTIRNLVSLSDYDFILNNKFVFDEVCSVFKKYFLRFNMSLDDMNNYCSKCDGFQKKLM